MKKIIFWTLAGIIVLLCVALVGGYVVLSRYDFNEFKPQIKSAVQEATGRELTIAGDIDLDIGLTPALLVEGLRFQNADWGSKPDMVSIKRMEVQLNLRPLLSGQVAVKKFILLDADILIETDPKGRLNVAFEKAPSEKKPSKPTADQKPSQKTGQESTLPAVALDQVQVQNSRFTYRDGKTEQATTFLIKKLTLKAPAFDQPVQLALDGSLHEAAIALAGTLGPLPALTDANQKWPLKLDIDAMGTALNLDGSIQDAQSQKGIDIAFDFDLKDRAALERFLKTTLPAIDPIKLSGKVSDTGPKAFQIADIKAVLGPSTLSGNAAIDLATKTPNIKADFASDKLDLRPFAEPADKKKAEPAVKKSPKSARTGKVFPDDPLPLDGLKAVTAEIAFKAGQILLPKLQLAKVNGVASLKNGNLTLKPLTAVLGGGNLDSHLSLTPKDKAAVLKANLKIDKLGVSALTKEAGLPEGLDGILDLDVDLSGSGASVAKLMAGLNGHVSLIVDDGRIHNKYIELLNSDFVTGLLGLLNPARSKKDYTAVECFVTRFDVKSGIATPTTLLFDSDLMRVAGVGKIDLRTEVLDLKMKPKPKKTLGTEKGALGVSLSELAQPFMLGGTLAEPSLKIDKAAAAASLGKTVGGIALLGPVGVAAALVGSTDAEKDPCAVAIQIAKTGVVPKQKTESKSTQQQTENKSVTDKVKDLPNIGNTLKNLFGN